MEEKVIKKTEESINKIIDEGLNTNNLDTLYKLVDIYKDIKEAKEMNYGNYNGYGNYGRGNYGRDEYGREQYDEYGARRRDSRGRYRGDDSLERMESEYGRYNESRQRYGANNEESSKSFYYMVEALKDFVKVIEQEAENQQQKQMLRDALQQSMM